MIQEFVLYYVMAAKLLIYMRKKTGVTQIVFALAKHC